MTYQVQSAGFHERLRRIEAAHGAGSDSDKGGRAALTMSFLLNVALMIPVWFVLTKSLIMAHLGQSAYGARLAELGNTGGLPDLVAAMLRPDPLSLAVTQVLVPLLGA